MFLLIKLYILKTSHCGWNPEQNSTYNSPRIIKLIYYLSGYLRRGVNFAFFSHTVRVGSNFAKIEKKQN
jgi:hypothetical protein